MPLSPLDPKVFNEKLKAGLREKEQGIPSFDLNVLLQCIKYLIEAKKDGFKNITFDDVALKSEYIRKTIYLIETTTNSTIQFPDKIASDMILILATHPDTKSTKRAGEGKFSNKISFAEALANPKIATALSVNKYVDNIETLKIKNSEAEQKDEMLKYVAAAQKKLNTAITEFFNKPLEIKPKPPIIISKPLEAKKPPVPPTRPQNTVSSSVKDKINELEKKAKEAKEAAHKPDNKKPGSKH